MATLNLGRIKPVFQGAYNNSTAYVVDDIVTFGDETFICIQASTGNATSNASYWTKLAAKGTDGTDVSTTLTTQGDLIQKWFWFTKTWCRYKWTIFKNTRYRC